MNDPVYSVILTTFNRSHFIRRAVDSVLGQTFADFELLIVDDCSTDDTAAEVGAIADPRVRYLKTPENSGVSAARNVGIRNARGRYVAFLDDDDEYLADFLEATYGVLESAPPSVGFTWCGIVRVELSPAGERVVERDLWDPEPSPEQFRSFFMNRRFGTGRGFVVRREVFSEVGEFDERIRSAEDTEFFFRLVAAKKFCVVRGYHVKIHTHAGERLNVRSVHRAEAYEVIAERNLKYLEQWPLEHAHMRMVTAKLFYAAGAAGRARRHIRIALRLAPSYRPSWRTLIGFELLGPLQSGRRRGLSAVRDMLVGGKRT